MADEDGAAEITVVAAQRSRGVRRGFLFMVLAASIAVATYAFAPQIAERVPATAPAMASYRAWVDVQRIRLDAAVGSVADRLNEAASSSTGSDANSDGG